MLRKLRHLEVVGSSPTGGKGYHFLLYFPSICCQMSPTILSPDSRRLRTLFAAVVYVSEYVSKCGMYVRAADRTMKSIETGTHLQNQSELQKHVVFPTAVRTLSPLGLDHNRRPCLSSFQGCDTRPSSSSSCLPRLPKYRTRPPRTTLFRKRVETRRPQFFFLSFL